MGSAWAWGTVGVTQAADYRAVFSRADYRAVFSRAGAEPVTLSATAPSKRRLMRETVALRAMVAAARASGASAV